MPNRTPINFPRLSRSLDSIRGDIYARIDSTQDDLVARGLLPARLNLNKGIARGLIEIFAWGQKQVYGLIEALVKQAAPAYASGVWLDLHLASVGLSRKKATKAAGLVRFVRNPSAGGNVPIPAGRIVRTLPDGTGNIYRYVVTEPTVLPAEADHVDVPVVAEQYGAASNATVGQICELATPVTGIAGVTNTADWLTSEGADREDDEHAYERYVLRWMGNNGCTKYAYKAWALAVPGVVSVEILDKHPRGQGTVGVVVRGSAGLPTAALLARVEEAVASQTPVNDEWFVVSPDAVPVSVHGRLRYVAADPEHIAALAVQRLHSLFADKSTHADITPLQIGQDVPLDLLTAVVMAVPGVKSVEWLTPSGDVAVPKSGLAMLAAVAFEAVAEEEW